MSKLIRMTQQYVDECKKEFEKALSDAKMADGKITFTKTFACENRKAVIYFTAEAWSKMVMLIHNFDNEIAWHGVAKRTEDESIDEYIISDILVYPQEVTGATVEMDTESYATWIMENSEDDRFNHIHMQGHSHVNMTTAPSSVDLNHQEEILNMLDDDNFYIFMIWNKSFSNNAKIYDLKKNVLFENSDITIKLMGAAEDFEPFIKSAKEMVKSKTSGYISKSKSETYSKSDSPYNPLHSKDTSTISSLKTRSKIESGYGGSEMYFDDYYDYYENCLLKNRKGEK